MGKKDQEFGSQADLIKNEAGMAEEEPRKRFSKGLLSRNASVQSKASEFESVRPDQKVLTIDEKAFLLYVERGDVAQVKSLVKAFSNKKNIFDINCMDPLGRTGLIIAIENENLELMQFLLATSGIEPRDAILVAIREDYVDGVESLLQYEEDVHKEGDLYTWEKVDQVTANFTPDVTPVILAAQRNNYEILKMLLDRGATIPMPHDVKCSCEECLTSSGDDSLRFSLSRINAYKALASPSLIALSSKDPVLTAFQLSNELKRLAVMESQFKEEYKALRKKVQEFAVKLVGEARTSYELEVCLNHNPGGIPWQPGTIQTLKRLQLAIHSKQKEFVAHPSVQQLLGAIWYDGLPGFRRLHIIRQLLCVVKYACMFPLFSTIYILAPKSSMGKFARKPFLKFIFESASYIFFLFLLALASQQIEHIVMDVITFLFPTTPIGIFLAELQSNWRKYERGSLPTPIEMIIILWVQGLIWKSLKEVFKVGLIDYLLNLWNLADIFSYGSFMGWIGLRTISFLWVWKLRFDGVPDEEIWIPRNQWHPFDPMLLSEGLFGAGMISSYLKLINIFSINPYLGPLQVSLGKMIVDICQFLVLYVLVLFSFGCGLNQLLWYYADLERQKCYCLPDGLPDWDGAGESCVMWRRFANLWETSQSLFWASFGLVELGDFDLTDIPTFTRFWGLLMFGSYSVCNLIVLLNMLIAMMSTSYTAISLRSDTEWKFARSKLWISYFEEGSTVPPPFNMIPTPKSFMRFFKCKLFKHKSDLYTEDDQNAADDRYYGVMRCIVRRYVTSEQRKSENTNITEDDINEVRQDIRSFKYEMVNIFKMNQWQTPVLKEDMFSKKSRNLERQIQKGFQISKTDGGGKDIFAMAAMGLSKQMSHSSRTSSMRSKVVLSGKDKFRGLALKAIKQENDGSTPSRDPIGRRDHSLRRKQNSLRKSLLQRGNSAEEIAGILALNSEELVIYNPKLADFTPTTRMAYARFRNVIKRDLHPHLEEDEEMLKTPSKMVVKMENEKIKEQLPPKSSSKELEKNILDNSNPLPPKSLQSEVILEPIKLQPNNVKENHHTISSNTSPTPSKMPPKTSSKSPLKTPPKTPPSNIQPKLSPKVSPKTTPKMSPKISPKTTPREPPKTPKRTPQRKEETPTSNISSKTPESKLTASSSKAVTPSKSPKHPVLEVTSEDDFVAKFDPKGKSISTGKPVTGWL